MAKTRKLYDSTRSSKLVNVFWGNRIESYTIILDGTPVPGFFHIGKGHIFTSNTKGDRDPDKGCVELMAVNNTSKDEPPQSLLLNSYYDEPSVQDKCQIDGYKIDHPVMFRIIECIADEIEIPYIKLVDGARKLLSGCPWNLRILNRLLHPEKTTFYEKFGFTTRKETLRPRARGAKFPRDAYKYLTDATKDYMNKHKLLLVHDLVTHMYNKCNKKRKFKEYSFLEKDIIHALEQSNQLPDSKDNKTYTKEVHRTHRCFVNRPGKTITFTRIGEFT